MNRQRPVTSGTVDRSTTRRTARSRVVRAPSRAAISVTHRTPLPQWSKTNTTDGVAGNLTCVLAQIGIGAALVTFRFARRRQHC